MAMRILFLMTALIFYASGVFAKIALTDISGVHLLTAEKVSVGLANKKGVVVFFLSAKCPCSDSHIEELKDLAKVYSDFSFVAIHSNVDEEVALAKEYFKKQDLPFPVIQDEKAAIADRFNALKTPHSFVVLPTGELAYQGGVSNSKDCKKSDRKFLREALDDLQNNRTVKTSEGRTLGCVISRGESFVW